MKKTVLAAMLLLGSTTVMASSGTLRLHAVLDGSSVTYGGDPNGEGSFTASVDHGDGRICYQLRASNIGTAVRAHIHEGASGSPGRPVVNLEVENDQCSDVPEAVLNDMIDNPSDYYVDILTSAYPQGAIRGQLVLN